MLSHGVLYRSEMDAELGMAMARVQRKQLGLVALWQLRQASVPDNLVRRARTGGHLNVFRSGVLVSPSAPSHPFQPLLAACLAAGPDAVASHWAAGAVHRMPRVAPGALEISAPGNVRLAGVTVHRVSLPIHPLDQDRRCGVPTTSVARTLVDLAGTGRLWLIERALDDALVRGLCRLSDVHASLDRAGRRHGVTGLRKLLDARREERIDSHQELRWIRLIRAEVGAEPVLHHRVSLAEGVFEIDIGFPSDMVGFEVNGWAAHGTRSAFDHDARKGLALLAAGWNIGVLTSAMSNQAVISGIRRVLALHRQSGVQNGTR